MENEEKQSFTKEEVAEMLAKTKDEYEKKIKELSGNVKLSDEDVIQKVNEILDIAPKDRTEEQVKTLDSLKEQYMNAMFNADYNDAKTWSKDNYDGNIEDIIKNADFVEFASGFNAPLKDLIAKYLKYCMKTNEVKNPGSIKTKGNANVKDFYTKEDVEKMSKAEIKKNYQVIKKSIPKWDK